MSGATIGGAVGFVVGWFFGVPQLGYMVGSAIGGYVDPVKIQGPRLGDARVQTSRDGIPIPFGWGTFPTAGNIIWQADPVEHKHTERQGKGGPETTTYTYTRSYAVGVCRPIAGYLQIYRNKKLVWDARNDDSLFAEYVRTLGAVEAYVRIMERRAENSRFLDRVAMYLGDESQSPDPTIEAYKGVGNVSSYRGLAYIVVTDDDVTNEAGAIPQYDFVVAGQGTFSEVECANPANVFAATDDGTNNQVYISDGITWGDSVDPGIVASGTTSLFEGNNLVFRLTSGSGTSRVSDDLGQSWETITGLETQTPNSLVYVSGSGRYLIFYGGGSSASFSTNGTSFSSFSVESRTYYGAAAIGDVVVVGSSNGHVIRSTNGGVSFGAAFPVGGGDLAHAHVVAAGDRFVASRGASVWVSDTGASGTWTEHATGLTSIEGLAYGLGYVVALNVDGKTSRSVDLGETWELGDDLDLTTAGGNTNNLAFCVNAFIAVGGDRKVYRSTNGSNFTNVWNPGSTPSIDLEWVCCVPGIPSGFIPIPDAPGYYVDASGTIFSTCTGGIVETDTVVLATIVGDLCRMEGLTTDEYDVSQLTDIVTGFRIANEGGADSAIMPLAAAYRFDVAEWDGKLRFIKRGGPAVFALNSDDLAERDGASFQPERVQESELLRRVTVAYIDPVASYGPTTQKWERRVGTVKARGELAVEIPITASADEAATIAARRGLIAWGEPEKQKFSLPYRWAKLTPTDVGSYTADDGNVTPLRLMQIDDDSGVRINESAWNCPEAYDATAEGVIPVAPTLPNAALIGPTNLVIMDLPLWRSSDPDNLGLYLAGAGFLGSWNGALVEVSTDEGASYTTAAEITVPATIGYTTTALDGWSTPENPETTSVTVWLPDAPSSIDYPTLLRYNNRAAIQNDSGEWQILQYQTVTALGDNEYTLSGLILGRYATEPGNAAAGATFVLLDASIIFATIERDYMGQILTVRATSSGTSSDGAVPFDYAVDASPASQTEWPVHYVTAERDTSGDIEVSCILRARLGTETSPFHSAHFAGVRFSYSDGFDTFSYDVSRATIGSNPTASHTYTAAQQAADFGSPSGGITVTIYPLNDITGAGPGSEEITV